MTDCSICLEDNNDTKIKLNCGHEFHFDCIIKVENNSCPLCRDVIINEPICNGGHFTYFNTSFVNKKGKCILCDKKTYKFYLKQMIKQ